MKCHHALLFSPLCQLHYYFHPTSCIIYFQIDYLFRMVHSCDPEVEMILQSFGKHIIFSIVFIALLTSFCSSADDTKKKVTQSKKSIVHTITSIDELNKIITNAGDRLLLFDLYADWCMPCKILSPMLEQIAEEQKNKVTVYKINIDKNPDIAGGFGVSGIPFVVYVKNQQGIHAFTGVQTKDTYVRAIKQFAQSAAVPDDVTADGELIDGVRVIRLATGMTPGNIYVYRGETVALSIDRVAFPYSIHIPAFNISQTGEVGKKMEIKFKAKEIGVFPIFCNGKCPAGDGAQYGRIIVMQYKTSGEAKFTEVTVEEALKLIKDKKALVLDVRTPNEFYSGHIEGAKLIPVQQLDARLSELSTYKNKDILVYCRSGNRSTVASQILIKNGFKKLHNLRNGVKGWTKAKQKLVKE